MLKERFNAKVATTEDSVRYTFFYALLSSGACDHTYVIIEHPHPIIVGRKKIDFIVASSNDRPSRAFEFKYDREIPSHQKLNKTNRAGAVFNDLFRLTYIPESTAQIKYFVYLTDSQMASYFLNQDNGYGDFFNLITGQSFEIDTAFLGTRVPSFWDKISCDPIPCVASGFFASDLGEEHSLRVYEVKSSNTDSLAF